jgi:FkbM family methyltransferase
MTPEQIADRESVWKQMATLHPEFTRDYDATDNYHAVREIVMGGSITWAGANARFQPRAGSRVMDVGANAGIYSTFCALKGAEVTAYEPYRLVFSFFAKMVQHKSLSDRIRMINAAIWTYTGKCPFIGNASSLDGACPSYNGGTSTKGTHWVPGDLEIAESVDCISFEEAIGEKEWDCVKMDIEGAEFEVLLATPPAALERIKFMYVEFHPWTEQDLYDQTIAKLKNIFRFEGAYITARDRWDSAYLFGRN